MLDELNYQLRKAEETMQPNHYFTDKTPIAWYFLILRFIGGVSLVKHFEPLLSENNFTLLVGGYGLLQLLALWIYLSDWGQSFALFYVLSFCLGVVTLIDFGYPLPTLLLIIVYLVPISFLFSIFVLLDYIRKAPTRKRLRNEIWSLEQSIRSDNIQARKAQWGNFILWECGRCGKKCENEGEIPYSGWFSSLKRPTCEGFSKHGHEWIIISGRD